MGYDLYFWPSASTSDAARLAELLADEDAEAMPRSERVLAFRAELLRRWPVFADRISPWHHDLDWRRPWGRTDLADRFVSVTLPPNWEHIEQLPELAVRHELDCYDPQIDEFLVPVQPQAAVNQDGVVPAVNGGVREQDIAGLLTRIGRLIRYSYDDVDAVALVGALDRTSDETSDAWFWYPLAGRPPLTVYLARSPHSGLVSIRIEGDMDPRLAAHIETMIKPP